MDYGTQGERFKGYKLTFKVGPDAMDEMVSLARPSEERIPRAMVPDIVFPRPASHAHARLGLDKYPVFSKNLTQKVWVCFCFCAKKYFSLSNGPRLGGETESASTLMNIP